MNLDILFAVQEHRVRQACAKAYVGPVTLRSLWRPRAEPSNPSTVRISVMRSLGHEAAPGKPTTYCACGAIKSYKADRCRQCSHAMQAGTWNRKAKRTCGCGRCRDAGRNQRRQKGVAA